MPQELLKLIQDSETELWLTNYVPEDAGASAFGNESNATVFSTEEQRETVLAALNNGYLVARYVGGDRPNLPPKNP